MHGVEGLRHLGFASALAGDVARTFLRPAAPMTDTVVCTFDDLASAESARAALVADGFDARALQLTVLDDEAGPAEGNFVAGNGAVSVGGNTAFRPQPPKDAYRQDYQPVRRRAGNLLCVAVEDPQDRSRVEAIVARFGALRPV
jgi:hypothetical protein